MVFSSSRTLPGHECWVRRASASSLKPCTDFAFSLANVGARLALTRRLQERTPHGAIGGVTAVSRFAANGVSVGMKALVGAAFALGAGPRAAFAVVGGGLALVAAAQFGLAAHLRSSALEAPEPA